MSDPVRNLLREAFGDLPQGMQDDAIEMFEQYREAKRKYDEARKDLAAFNEMIGVFRAGRTGANEPRANGNVLNFTRALEAKQK